MSKLIIYFCCHFIYIYRSLLSREKNIEVQCSEGGEQIHIWWLSDQNSKKKSLSITTPKTPDAFFHSYQTNSSFRASSLFLASMFRALDNLMRCVYLEEISMISMMICDLRFAVLKMNDTSPPPRPPAPPAPAPPRPDPPRPKRFTETPRPESTL